MNRNMYTPRPFLSYHESPQLMPPAKPKSKNLEIPKGLKYDGSSSWKTFYTSFRGMLIVYRGLPRNEKTNCVGVYMAKQPVKHLEIFPTIICTHKLSGKYARDASDKEAGQHGATARPTSVEAAIDQIKWFQHNHTAIFGKPTGRRDPTPNQDEPSYDYDSDLAVHAIGKTDTKSELSKQMETLLEKMTAMEALHKQEIGDLKQQFQKQQQAKQFPAQNEVQPAAQPFSQQTNKQGNRQQWRNRDNRQDNQRQSPFKGAGDPYHLRN
ncbi:Hypothetical predicted protein [Mytilus galloprovincialis]|uniref:Uncharacterized protein n=1 Tax=Mytilus galloprovincialis TaxID=29158 RepID=A0A8B6CHA0_MYTGA|nr:Hypothetical predicted protein [Mytilus galloprovincialis]